MNELKKENMIQFTLNPIFIKWMLNLEKTESTKSYKFGFSVN